MTRLRGPTPGKRGEAVRVPDYPEEQTDLFVSTNSSFNEREETAKNVSFKATAVESKALRRRAQQAPKVIEKIKSISFSPSDDELSSTWTTGASRILCVSPYVNGVALSLHVNEGNSQEAPVVSEEGKKAISEKVPAEPAAPAVRYLPSQFHLRLPDTKNYLPPPGRYFLYKENFSQALERRLAQLSDQGLLLSTVIFFGSITDPFLSLQKKFAVTMRCLELFEHFQPGLLVLQTRSPMVISALPTLKLLADKALVAMPLETPSEAAIVRYTPGQPRIEERLVAARGLRIQGIKVNLMASPVLPYGDILRDAWDFAELLTENADFVTLSCLACGGPAEEAQLRALPIAKKLAADQQYRLLRPHAYRHLYHALKVLAPEKLKVPLKRLGSPKQLSLFAAA